VKISLHNKMVSLFHQAAAGAIFVDRRAEATCGPGETSPAGETSYRAGAAGA
jgi:hypothetical protein